MNVRSRFLYGLAMAMVSIWFLSDWPAAAYQFEGVVDCVPPETPPDPSRSTITAPAPNASFRVGQVMTQQSDHVFHVKKIADDPVIGQKFTAGGGNQNNNNNMQSWASMWVGAGADWEIGHCEKKTAWFVVATTTMQPPCGGYVVNAWNSLWELLPVPESPARRYNPATVNFTVTGCQ